MKCGQVAVIARMNATLFNEMVKVVRGGRQLKLGFAGVRENVFHDCLCDFAVLGLPFNSTYIHTTQHNTSHSLI